MFKSTLANVVTAIKNIIVVNFYIMKSKLGAKTTTSSTEELPTDVKSINWGKLFRGEYIVNQHAEEKATSDMVFITGAQSTLRAFSFIIPLVLFIIGAPFWIFFIGMFSFMTLDYKATVKMTTNLIKYNASFSKYEQNS